jgi:proteic killer suppression protein
MIQSFAGRETRLLFEQNGDGKFTGIERVALRKLIQMNQAVRLSDLAVPPGNRLESLRGNLRGWHSIRINNQWRILFRWTDYGPDSVQIADYH